MNTNCFYRKLKPLHCHVGMGCYIKGKNVALGSHRLSFDLNPWLI